MLDNRCFEGLHGASDNGLTVSNNMVVVLH